MKSWGLKTTATLLSLLLLALLTGCSGGAAPSAGGTGAIAIKLKWSDGKSAAKTAALAPDGVTRVRIIVTGVGTNPVQYEFDASTGSGNISGVPAGTGLTVTTQGLDVTGAVIYQFSVCNVTVSQNSVTDLGTITMVPAVCTTLHQGSSGSVTLQDSASHSLLNFNFPAHAVVKDTTVAMSSVNPQSLPKALDEGNAYVTGFTVTANPATVTVFQAPATMTGAVASSIATGATLSVAKWDVAGKAWKDVTTLIVGANSGFVQSFISETLPGIVTPGTYVVYQSQRTTAVSNLGIVLLADDGMGSGALQVIRIYDQNGKVLATPTVQNIAYPNAYDLDGQALTPDGSQGIMVDGGSTLRFFSNVQTGNPVASTVTLSTAGYGYDGDSVAIMPDGDEAVVSNDDAGTLLVVSSILSGQPKLATTITVPDYRDGVVISNDGKVLLARGSSGVTVYSIARIAPTTGTIGGTVTHSFTQLANLITVPSPTLSDGRNGMALSPVDSNRALVIGSQNGPAVALLSQLQTTPTVDATFTVRGVGTIFCASITPDGTMAVLGTDQGLVLLTGVNTGNLTQVGATGFAPGYTDSLANTMKLQTVYTLGITLDGLYAVAGDNANRAVVVIPINAKSDAGFNSPVGVVTGVAIPYDDQMLVH